MNTPRGNTNATAEHTLALLLALSRKIPKGNKSTHEGLWEKKKLKGRVHSTSAAPNTNEYKHW